MAVIKGIDCSPVLTDIKSAMTNAFAQVGGTWYFGYINTSGNAVVYASDDLGAHWELHQDYGRWSFVSVTSTYDSSSLVVALTGTALNQTVVYKDDAVVMEADGTVATNGAVCLYPYLILMQDYFLSGAVGYPSGGSTVGFASSPPIRGVLGYASGGQGVDVLAAASSDVGPGWSSNSAPYVIDQFAYHGATLQVRASKGDTAWVGLYSRTLSGFVNLTDFAGFSTGGVPAFIGDVSLPATRGVYFDGYQDTNTYVIADRGFRGPHQTVAASDVDGNLVAFWVDSGGLMGTVVDLTGASLTDASGQRTPFDTAKIYGTQPGVSWSTNAYCAATQSQSMTAFLLGQANGGSVYSLYRVHDPDVLTRPHAANTELYSQTTTITQSSLPTVRDPFQINPSSNAVGTVQTESTGPTFGISFLTRACTEPSILPNPNGSQGCSPVLRELLLESGVAFSVVREVARDGDPNGHQGGNALDLAGPNSPTVLIGASVSDQAYQQMGEITSFLRQVPSLFASVIHYDPITPAASLFIWDGAIVTVDHFGGVQAQIVRDSTSNIHISSSLTRLLRGFQSPVVVAALGLSDAYTDPLTGQTTAGAPTDPFMSDRYVYVNNDGYQGSDVQGLAAQKLAAQIVNFW